MFIVWTNMSNICFLFFFATGYGAEFVSMLMWFAHFFAHFHCICMRVLIADVRFVQWVYLWEKLCEPIRVCFLLLEQLLLKFSIIWTCYLCDLLPSYDSLCYLWLYLSCFWWCMLLMHESIVEKETETNGFCWRVFLSTYLVFDCCWFWGGCHVGRIRARAHFWSISLWNPKKLFSQLA